MDTYDAVYPDHPENYGKVLERHVSRTREDILNALANSGWRGANCRKQWPPRRVVFQGGEIGYIMSRDMGFTQIATGVRSDGQLEWDWYFRTEYVLD